MLYVCVFVLGALIGSFLNVCISRLPAGESVVFPPSHCPKCHEPIRPRDNIPLLSYVLLKGRCRSCAGRISPRYPAVELFTGIVAILLLARFGVTPLFGVSALFAAALIVVSVIDIDHQIIPDVISLPGIVVGVSLAALTSALSLTDSLVGVALGGGMLYVVAVGYHALTGREGMGGGDIKLLAMIGAFVGWRGVLVTLVLGSFSGAVVGLTLIATRGGGARLPIPFGPFLAVGALCAVFFGDELIHWYLRLALSV